MRELKEVAESMEVRAYKAVKADGTRWVPHLQRALSVLSPVRMGLFINIKKTETMSIGPEEQFFIDRMPIKSVNRFKYLGSIVTSDCSVNAELITRIQAVSSYHTYQKSFTLAWSCLKDG